MNKRMKKKWSRVARLETKVAQLIAENVLLTEAVRRQNKLIEGILRNNERDFRRTKRKIDDLEITIEAIKKTKKKCWFGRY